MINLRNYSRVLTLFAHPDDETLAAGGTIAKLSDLGAKIFVAIPATGIDARKNIITEEETRNRLISELRLDCERALGELGILGKDNLFFGGFSDNEMDKHTLLELIHWFEQIIKVVSPDLIITHHKFCTNIDHQYCHDAVVVATRPSMAGHVDVICGEVPSSTGYIKPTQWEPNFHVVLDELYVNKKIKAMQSYKGESKRDPHPRSPEVLKALAKVRGSEAGFYFAESFMVQKIFG